MCLHESNTAAWLIFTERKISTASRQEAGRWELWLSFVLLVLLFVVVVSLCPETQYVGGGLGIVFESFSYVI